MNLVRPALRRPFTVLVLVLAVLLTGLMALQRMPRDIFPDLGVPVLYVAQPYGGLGPARALFVPLSLAVGFAMIGSYLLSSTLVPVLSVLLLRRRQGQGAAGAEAGASARGSGAAPAPSASVPAARPEPFERVRNGYAALVRPLVRLRWVILPAYLVGMAAVVMLVGGRLGVTVFPTVDAGQFSLRLRAPTGTRIDRTEELALKILQAVAREVGPENVDITLGFVGVQPPNYPINTIYLWTGGPEEAVLQVQLKPAANVRIEDLKERLRGRLPQALPEMTFSFEPSDIVGRVMSFGARTPIELAVSGPDLAASRRFAHRLAEQLARVPALRDVQVG